MKIDKIPAHVLEAIRQNLTTMGEPDYEDLTEDRKQFIDSRIKSMSASDAFEKYCNWHGLIGWARNIEDALDSLREAE